MQNVAIQKAGELPEPVRFAVERLLGRQVGLDEEISIVALPPQQIPSQGDRESTARRLEALLARRSATVANVPEADIDAVIEEAAEHVRQNRT